MSSWGFIENPCKDPACFRAQVCNLSLCCLGIYGSAKERIRSPKSREAFETQIPAGSVDVLQQRHPQVR